MTARRRRSARGRRTLGLSGLLALLGLALGAATADEGLRIPARHWETPFAPMPAPLVGSYTTVLRLGPERFVAFNNAVDAPDAAPATEGGLVRWTGRSPTELGQPTTVLGHAAITDVLDQAGRPHPRRMLTRPYVDWHPAHGFAGIVFVAAGYPPEDGLLYPALVSSRTGEPGAWTYHGKLRGEPWTMFGDPSPVRRWSDGGGFFFQPDKPPRLDRHAPLENRYVLFANLYLGLGSTILLVSADGSTWHFHRTDGQPDGPIADLTPVWAGRRMHFPHVVRAGRHGYVMFATEGWPAVALWRLISPDGLRWHPAGGQPELPVPAGVELKNLNGWYDPEADLLHGYLSVWRPAAGRVEKYHAVTRPVAGDGDDAR